MIRALLFLTVVMLTSTALQAEPVWPGREWERKSPAQAGMSPERLDEAAAYAQRFGGGSGCVIRDGFLVKEWGDPKALADIKS